MDQASKRAAIWVAATIVVLVVAILFVNSRKANNTNPSVGIDTFAQCLKDKGALFYGTFWCPHCQNQKAAFGDAQKNLPYVECSTPDGKEQTQECQNKNIQGYPTWIFADGSKLEGELSFETLSQKTGCPAPR